MDELIAQLTEKTGLAADQVKSVVDGVMDFLKEKLPGGMGEQIQGFLEGNADTVGDTAGGLVDKAKDILGGLTGGGDSA